MADSKTVVSALYAKVVTDVIAKSREEFLGEGLDATVLEELRVRWERKLAKAGVAPTAAAAAAAKAPEPAPKAQAPARAAAPPPPPPAVAAPSAPAPAAAPPPPPPAVRDEPLALLGRPLAFLPAATGWIMEDMPPAPAPPAPPAPAAQEPAQEDAGRKRKAPDSAVEAEAAAVVTQAQVVPVPPAPVAPVPQAAAPPDDDDDGLSSGSEEDEDEAETNNLVLSQFEKVSHTKSKWKCLLKSGMMTLNGKDRVFSSATCSFTW